MSNYRPFVPTATTAARPKGKTVPQQAPLVQQPHFTHPTQPYKEDDDFQTNADAGAVDLPVAQVAADERSTHSRMQDDEEEEQQASQELVSDHEDDDHHHPANGHDAAGAEEDQEEEEGEEDEDGSEDSNSSSSSDSDEKVLNAEIAAVSAKSDKPKKKRTSYKHTGPYRQASEIKEDLTRLCAEAKTVLEEFEHHLSHLDTDFDDVARAIKSGDRDKQQSAIRFYKRTEGFMNSNLTQLANLKVKLNRGKQEFVKVKNPLSTLNNQEAVVGVKRKREDGEPSKKKAKKAKLNK